MSRLGLNQRLRLRELLQLGGVLGGAQVPPLGESFATFTDSSGNEQFITVTDQNGIEQRLTVYTG